MEDDNNNIFLAPPLLCEYNENIIHSPHPLLGEYRNKREDFSWSNCLGEKLINKSALNEVVWSLSFFLQSREVKLRNDSHHNRYFDCLCKDVGCPFSLKFNNLGGDFYQLDLSSPFTPNSSTDLVHRCCPAVTTVPKKKQNLFWRNCFPVIQAIEQDKPKLKFKEGLKLAQEEGFDTSELAQQRFSAFMKTMLTKKEEIIEQVQKNVVAKRKRQRIDTQNSVEQQQQQQQTISATTPSEVVPIYENGFRKNALCIAMSYPDVRAQKEDCNVRLKNYLNPSIEQVIEIARDTKIRKSLYYNEMDLRDLIRLRKLEHMFAIRCFTVSLQKHMGRKYKRNRHINVDINVPTGTTRTPGFMQHLEEMGVKYNYIFIDWFWNPSGWTATVLCRPVFFHQTLPMLVKYLRHNGVIYLPCSTVMFKNVVAAFVEKDESTNNLKNLYELSYVHHNDRDVHLLWKATNDIDGDIMKEVFNKTKEQEDGYTGINRSALADDNKVTKAQLLAEYNRIHDPENVCFIKLTKR